MSKSKTVLEMTAAGLNRRTLRDDDATDAQKLLLQSPQRDPT